MSGLFHADVQWSKVTRKCYYIVSNNLSEAVQKIIHMYGEAHTAPPMSLSIEYVAHWNDAAELMLPTGAKVK